MRSREFLMKDAYSFHDSWESLDEAYKDFYSAYGKILERLGLDYLVVEADSGAIGGNESHEFNVLARYGESTLLYCDCGYAASDEKLSTLRSSCRIGTCGTRLISTPQSEREDSNDFLVSVQILERSLNISEKRYVWFVRETKNSNESD